LNNADFRTRLQVGRLPIGILGSWATHFAPVYPWFTPKLLSIKLFMRKPAHALKPMSNKFFACALAGVTLFLGAPKLYSQG